MRMEDYNVLSTEIERRAGPVWTSTESRWKVGTGEASQRTMPDLELRRKTGMWERSMIVSLESGWVARELV